MILEDTIEILTKQMIEEHFNNKDNTKYVITKQELYKFCIKLIKTINNFVDVEVKYDE